MLVNMLKAVSKMLEESKEPKVQCAKVIIDEIIDSQSAGGNYQDDSERLLPGVSSTDSDLDPEAQQAMEELT